jgi:Vitamin K-dependent gamma-carboxylase
MANYFRNLAERFGSAWTRFWFTPTDPAALSLIRLLTGLVAIWWYLGFYSELQHWIGPNGLYPLELTEQLRATRDGSFAFSLFDYTTSASQVWLVYGLGAIAILMMAVGLFTRFSTIASLVFVLSFIHRLPMLSRPADDVLAMLSFYLCIGPAGANFSLDAILRRRRETATPRPAGAALSSAATVATRLIQIHLALIYFSMAVAQLQVPEWWRGTAVWWIMARPDSRLVDFTGMAGMGLAFEYLVNFFTHAIVLYELCFSTLIWLPLARPLLLVLGLFIWAGLALITGAISFAALMLIASLAFLSPETVRGFMTKR